MKASIHCVVLVNYMTSRLTEVLETMGDDGYKLVSVVMAKDIVKQDCMYLFFQKTTREVMEIKALKQDATKFFAPLTLEQLKEMKGHKLLVKELGTGNEYIETLEEVGHNHIYLIDENGEPDTGAVELYGETWISYDYHPAHIDLEAWEPCENCNPKCAICANYGGWDRYGKPKICEDCKSLSNFIADDEFCSYCGRPLTPKARDELEKRLRG